MSDTKNTIKANMEVITEMNIIENYIMVTTVITDIIEEGVYTLSPSP